MMQPNEPFLVFMGSCELAALALWWPFGYGPGPFLAVLGCFAVIIAVLRVDR